MARLMLPLLIASLALGACSYRGGDIGDPAVRKLQWYSFVEGEDIRKTCQPGMPERYRLVYNGLWSEQIRIYQIDSLQKVLDVRVVQGGLNAPFAADDLLAPWRAGRADVAIDEAAFARLAESLDRSGLFDTPPVGLRLPSRSYYWTVAACRDGRYAFSAWKHPSPRFDAIAFDSVLFGLDPSPVLVNAPKDVPFDPQYENLKRHHETTDFTLEVGRNGLVR